MTRRVALLAALCLALVGGPLVAACSLAGDLTPPPANDASPAVRIGADLPSFQPSAAMGAAVYAAHCAACHGSSGLGDGPQASRLPNPPPSLADPSLFIRHTPAEVFAVITQGNLEGFMPPFGESLSELERWSAVYYLAALGAAPIEAGHVVGVVMNGTAGAVAPGGLQVTLHTFDGLEQVAAMTAQTEPDGRFRFDDVTPVADHNLIASVDYQGVTYASAWTPVDASTQGVTLPITVYETTDEPPAVRVALAHLVMEFTGGWPARLRAVERLAFYNDGDRTWVVGASGATREVNLPQGASNLGFQSGALGERFLPTDTGFADTQALPPGPDAAPLLLSFDLPYDSRLVFEQQSQYPVDEIVLLLPRDGPRLHGDRWRSTGLQTLGGTVYHVYQASDFQPGEAITFELSGSPDGSGLQPSAPLWVGLAALIIAVLGVGIIWVRTGS